VTLGCNELCAPAHSGFHIVASTFPSVSELFPPPMSSFDPTAVRKAVAEFYAQPSAEIPGPVSG